MSLIIGDELFFYQIDIFGKNYIKIRIIYFLFKIKVLNEKQKPNKNSNNNHFPVINKL